MAYKATSPLPEPASDDAFVSIAPFETAWMTTPGAVAIQGLKGSTRVTSWRFYIKHAPTDTKLWFDLGISQDLTVYPPYIQRVQHKIFNPEVGNTSPADDVRSLGDNPDDLQYIIFSHAHWDHVFPAASFHPNAKYLCGKGCFEYAMPCWPTDLDGGFDERVWDPKISDLPIEEFSDPAEAPDKWRQLGPFKKAYDFFGDGSFWIIDAPGHCLGNLAALARFRNKFGEAKWGYLGGDCFHCPHFVQHPEAPFGKGSPLTVTGSLHENEEEAREIIKQTAELKKGEGNDVLVWIAHCDTLEGSWQLS